MAVTIPASDVAHTNLNTAINNLTAHITNNSAASKLVRDKANLQHQLVLSLISTGKISCASILANETYLTTGAIPDGV